NWLVDDEGWYEFTATDTVTGCVSTDSFFVDLDSFEVDLMLDGNLNLLCSEDSTIITAISSTPDAVFEWLGISISDRFNPTQTLEVGAYIVRAEAPNGCSASLPVLITAPDPLIIGYNYTVDCQGNIELIVLPTGGTAPYTWQIDPPGPLQGSSSYIIEVTDNNGCSATKSGVTPPVSPLFTAATKTDETVAGAADGTATVSAVGGTRPYMFLWNTGDTTATISNLPPGDYTVTTTDAMDCSRIDTVTILPGVSATRELPGLESLVLSPNPTSGFFDLKLQFAQPQDVSAELLDMTGRVLERKIFTNSATPAWQFDLSAHA